MKHHVATVEPASEHRYKGIEYYQQSEIGVFMLMPVLDPTQEHVHTDHSEQERLAEGSNEQVRRNQPPQLKAAQLVEHEKQRVWVDHLVRHAEAQQEDTCHEVAREGRH